jgi:hypothetical protein
MPLSPTVTHGGTPLYPVVVGTLHDKGCFGFRHFSASDLARSPLNSSDFTQPERYFVASSNPSRYLAGASMAETMIMAEEKSKPS